MKNSNSILSYISKNQVIVAVLFVFIAWLLFRIINILILIFIAYILMASLYPFVVTLRKRNVPKVFAVIIPYIVVLLIALLLIFSLIPLVLSQVQLFISHLPNYTTQAAHLFGKNIDASALNASLGSTIGTVGENVFAVTGVVFGSVFFALTLIVISFYLLIDHDNLIKNFTELFPQKSQKRIAGVIVQVEEKLGEWFRGQIVLSLSIGLGNWLAYSIIGLDFALPLAVLAGMFEIIPTIGPFLGAIPAVIVALNTSVPLGVTVIIIYFIIQMLESNLLVPKIMQHAVGLNPLIVLLGIIIGGELLGIGGALLSVPFIALVVVIYNNIRFGPRTS